MPCLEALSGPLDDEPAFPLFPAQEKMQATEGDIGERLHSPSAAFMKLVDCDHLNDFEAVCAYLAEHAMEVSE